MATGLTPRNDDADKIVKDIEKVENLIKAQLAQDSKVNVDVSEAVKLVKSHTTMTSKNISELTKALQMLASTGKIETDSLNIFKKSVKDYKTRTIDSTEFLRRQNVVLARTQEHLKEVAEAEKKAAAQEKARAKEVETTATKTANAAKKRENAAKQNQKADDVEVTSTKRVTKAQKEAAAETEKITKKQENSTKKNEKTVTISNEKIAKAAKTLAKSLQMTYKSGDVDKMVRSISSGFVKINNSIDATSAKVEHLAEQLRNLSTGGNIQVRINNSGFDKVVQTFAGAITAAEKRMKRAGQTGNPLNRLLTGQPIGSKAPGVTKPSGPTDTFKKLLKSQFGDTADTIASEIDRAFSEKVSKALTKNLSTAIRGTMEGWSKDIIKDSQLDWLRTVTAMFKGSKLSDAVKLNIVSQMFKRPGDNSPTGDYQEFLKYELGRQNRKASADANANAAVEIEKFAKVFSNDGKFAEDTADEFRKQAVARTRKAESEARTAEKLEKEEDSNVRAAEANAERQEIALDKARAESSKTEYIREQFFSKVGEAAGRLNAFDNKELTALDKAEIKLTNVKERFEEIAQKAMDGKINISQVDKVMTDLYKATQQVAQEWVKLNVMGDFNSKLDYNKKLAKRYTFFDQVFQALGNLNSAAGSVFSNIANTFRSMFNVIRNDLTRILYRVRSMITSMVSTATEQYSKLENAQIGFENFFGQGDAIRLVSRIKEEAIKAPSLSAGDLADYVSSLAPVSKGDPNLALNAALGILKTVQYSGGDASTEMSRVVTNIRDVVSKGQANAVDIRQFQRAMPAIEQALEKLGASEFLKDGQLNVTKENARTILKAFSDLNTNPNSPVADIFNRYGRNWSGMVEAFSEQWTQTSTNILEKSGAFDLAKRILGDASNDSIFSYVETVGTKIVKKLVDFLDRTLTLENFNDIFQKFQTGWEMLKKTVHEALMAFKEFIPEDIKEDWITGGFKLISNAVKAFADGWKQVLSVMKWIAEHVDPKVMETAASAIGLFMSPFTKMVTTVSKIAGNLLGIVQNTAKTLNKLLTSWSDVYQRWGERFSREIAIQWQSENRQFSEANIKAVASQIIASFESSKRSNGGTGVAENVTITADGTLYRNGKVDAEATKLIQSTGGWSNLSSADKQSLVGISKGKYALGTIQNKMMSVVNTFATQLGKIVTGGSLLAAGEGIASLAESADDATFVFGNLIKTLGGGLTGYGLGKTLGSIIDPMAAQLGGILGATLGMGLTIMDAINKSKVMKEEQATKNIEKLDDAFKQSLVDQIADLVGIDTKSNKGYYAYKELQSYIGKTDSNLLLGNGEEGSGFHGANEVIRTLSAFAQSRLNLYSQSDFMEMVDDFKEGSNNTELSDLAQEFHDLGEKGEIFTDFGQDASEEAKEIRDNLVEMIRTLHLLSDSDLEGTDEQILERFLTDLVGNNGVAKISSEQYKFLMDRYALAQESFTTDLDRILSQFDSGGKFDNMDKNIEQIKEIIDKRLKEGAAESEEGAINPDSQTNLETGKGVAHSSRNPYTVFKESGEFTDDSINGIIGHFGFGNDNATRFDFLSDEANNNLNALGGNALSHLFNALQQNAFWADKLGDMDALEDVGEVISMLTEPDWENLSGTAAFEKFEEILRKIAEKGLGKYLEPKYMKKVYESTSPTKEITINGITLTIPSGNKVTAASGKYIDGKGVDTVNAMLQPGEFVVRRSSVNQAGLGVLSALNRGDLAAAARGLGLRLGTNSWNNSRNWSSVTNNNQRSARNYIKIVNRNLSARQSTYYNLANRIAMA